MPVEKWSQNVLVVRLGEDPHLGEDLDALDDATAKPAAPLSAVVDFSSVKMVNSSTLARLIKVRRQMAAGSGRLILCGMNDQVWGAFLVTNLDKLFEVSNSVAMALATLQMNPSTRPPE
jgi:anti-anti-sigma factor